MAWLDLFRGRKSASAYDLLRAAHDLISVSSSGKTVSLETAQRVATAFGCGRVIGHGMATPPLKIRRRDGRKRVASDDHPVAQVWRKPNPWQTGFELREMLSWHVEFCGRAICYKNRSTRGELLELIPFEPRSVTVKRAEDFTLTYEVRAQSGKTMVFPAEVIWHLRGPSWNGWEGMDVLEKARDALGLAMAVEESQAALHKNGVRTSGVYSLEGKMGLQQFADLRAWIEKEHASAANAGKPMILDRAAKWIQTQMTGVDAQSLETRKQQIEEVCRVFGVMPIMIGYSDKAATYASAEQMFRAHVDHCLSPRWTRFEASADAALLTERDLEEGYYHDIVEEGMIRGSVKDTKDAILGYVNGGVLTPNEGRELLDRDPVVDPAADELRIPVNTVQDPKADKTEAP